jgi:hypothetical protein
VEGGGAVSSFALRIRPMHEGSTDPRVRMQVFAGPDEHHRALSGELVMTLEEAVDFGNVTGLPEARP